MKTKFYNSRNSWQNVLVMPLVLMVAVAMTSCEDNDPEKEDVPELITKATLRFIPAGSGTEVTVTATDPDGEGVQDIVVDGPINLAASTSYTLSIELVNELAEPTDEEYDISAEVEEEGDEHMFFFGWTNNVFSDPTGDGNTDNRANTVNYLDEDENELPLGLSTFWTTNSASTGTFRVVLKHQPDLKTEDSDINVGETDLDITFTINVN